MRLRKLIQSIQKSKSDISRISVLFVFVFGLLLLGSSKAIASEKEAAPAEKSSALKVKPPCRWSEHESRLMSYMAKIRSLEKEISDMIDSKHHVDSSEKVRMITQQISYKHSDLGKVVREYESERIHIRFQHPDRDLEGDRRYTAVRFKSIGEIEEAFGLDGRLDRIRRQVDVVFPTTDRAVGDEKRKPASAKTDDSDEIPSGVHLVK